MIIEVWDLDFNKLACTLHEVEKITYQANIVIAFRNGEEFFRFNIVKYNYEIRNN